MKSRLYEAAGSFGVSIDLEHVALVERNGDHFAKVYLVGHGEPIQLYASDAGPFLSAWRAYHNAPDDDPTKVEPVRMPVAGPGATR